MGYFRTSGFHLLYSAMENVKKTRVLVGLNVDLQTKEMINGTNDVEQGVKKFIEWIKNDITPFCMNNMFLFEEDIKTDKRLIHRGIFKNKW